MSNHHNRRIDRIERGDFGDVNFIADGYRFTSKDFLQPIAHAKGFEPHRKMKDASEDIPEA